MNIEQMKQIKNELGLTNEDVAAQSGVPLGTVQKIFAGITKIPRRETLSALQRFFSQELEGSLSVSVSDTQPPEILREAQTAYAKKDGYTLADYLALPEEQRVELIDGVFYDMSAPTTIHQAIGGFIYKVDDRRTDASVLRQINDLKKAFEFNNTNRII